VSPNDPGLRQTALDKAGRVAESFQYTASSLGQQAAEADRSIIDTVTQLNYLAGRIAALNKEFRSDYRCQTDPGLNAQMADLLEQVSQIADTNVVKQDDGSVTVYVGDQSLLVVGDKAYSLTADTSGVPAVVQDAQGLDIGPALNGGSLHALLQFRNEDIPSYKTQLDRLAQSVADTVNTQLAAGLDQNGQTPTANLFSYDAGVGAASTLAVNPLTTGQLALASAGAPGGNGNALALSKLDGTRAVDGFTFQQFYGNIAAEAGRAVATAKSNVESNSQMVAQARTWRDEISRVDLNEEAAQMIEYQRSFEAAARMVTTLNEMTQSLIDILR
jgi:flagellar hook-associated protein 1 FlgK